MSFRSIGPALQDLLSEWLENPEARRVMLERTWQRALGDEIGSRCRPLGFEEGTLTVEVTDDGWRSHLMDMGPELIGKINAAVGNEWVRRIDWV